MPNYIQPIYTIKNWVMINYLFNNGNESGDSVPVFLDAGSEAYRTKLEAVAKHSTYLAAIVEQHAATNGVIFEWQGEGPKEPLPKAIKAPNTKAYGKIYVRQQLKSSR